MKTININGSQVELNYANALTAGYGHKEITVELCYEGEYKTFKAVTNNMPGFDDAQDIEDYEEKQLALFELVDYKIEDEVSEWIAEIDSTN